MNKLSQILFFMASILMLSNMSHARPDPTVESQNALGQKIVDTIKVSCSNAHPVDEAKFKECATVRYDAMKWFFSTLYHHRDTKGIESEGFKKGIECSLKYSPYVNEPGRKQALELSDWLKIKSCYKASLAR